MGTSLHNDLQLRSHALPCCPGSQIREERRDINSRGIVAPSQVGYSFGLEECPVHSVRVHVGAEQGRFYGLAQDPLISMAKGQADRSDAHSSPVGERAIRIYCSTCRAVISPFGKHGQDLAYSWAIPPSGLC